VEATGTERANPFSATHTRGVASYPVR